MPYGTIKIDTITFTDAGVDKSITVSGLVQNPTFTGNVTVTGTVSGATVRATTVSGVTVSGTTANFASGVFTTQISGAIHVAPAGTAGAPTVQVGTGASIAPGLYSPATDQLGISTGGSFRLVVDSTGRVGIGTSGPNRLLEVSGPSGTDNFLRVNVAGGAAKSGIELSHGGAAYAQLYYNNVAPYDVSLLQQYITGSLIFGTNNTERLRIDSSGNVGIGTSSPVTALHVVGTATFVGTAIFGNGIGGRLQATTDSNLGYIDSLNNTSTQWQPLIERGTEIQFHTNTAGVTPTQKVVIDSSGRLGVGTTSPSSGLHLNNATAGSAANFTISNPANNWSIRTGTTENALVFVDNQFVSEKARIDSSGRLLLGTSSSLTGGAWVNGAATQVAFRHQVASVNWNEGSIGLFSYETANNAAAQLSFNKSSSNTLGTFGSALVSGTDIGSIVFSGSDGSKFVPGALIAAEVDGTSGTDDMPGRLVFSTTADGASSPTERMRIDNAGNFLVGFNSGSNHRIGKQGGSVGTILLTVEASGGDHVFQQVDSLLFNAANTGLKLGRNSITGRSLNAGGTVNASGADYAEYMIKAGDFSIAKGDVCGVTTNGLLTQNFVDAVSFVVKSTNPSYVGGDTWGNEDAVGPKPDADDSDALAQWEADLEAARQAVDRIAFAGQVPVNVTGATPGQYIVPIESADGGITGTAKDEADLTLAEYMRAVGKVIAIEDDGRARIIVKVA